MAAEFEQLHSHAKDKLASFRHIKSLQQIELAFHHPLPLEATLALPHLSVSISQAGGPGSDTWTLRHSQAPLSSGLLYKLNFASISAPITHKWIWKSRCTPRMKFFAWLLLVDRLNMRDMLARRYLQVQGGPNYILCHHGVIEDINHLFFQCEQV